MTSSKYRLFHIPLFLFGVVYYLISPLVVLYWNVFEDMPGMHLFDKYDINSYVPSYFLLVCLITVSFLSGSILPLSYIKNINIEKRPHIYRRVNLKSVFMIMAPLLIIVHYQIFSNRSILLKGYSVDYNTELLGSIATVNSVLLVFYLLSREFRNNKVFNWLLLFFICELSVLLLGLGSRMYVLIPLIAMGLRYVSLHSISKKIFLRSFLGVLLFCGIGVWRISSDINIDSLLFIGLAEPLFTWISAISFFNYNEIPFIAFPSNYLASFMNFIPTILFPNKADYIIGISGPFDFPLGATNIMVSVLSNFGILGSVVFFFTVGFILTVIRYNWRSSFGTIYYYCVCSIIPFQFFRDSFTIVNKMIFFNFLIIPGITVLLILFLSDVSKGPWNEYHRQI